MHAPADRWWRRLPSSDVVRMAIVRCGSHPAAVWMVRHVVSRLDRAVIRLSKGRVPPAKRSASPDASAHDRGPELGEGRTTPLVVVRTADGFVVANARPAGERQNPWSLNLRAAGWAESLSGYGPQRWSPRELDDAEAEIWWPRLVAVWPASGDHYAATGDRTVFELRPRPTGGAGTGTADAHRAPGH